MRRDGRGGPRRPAAAARRRTADPFERGGLAGGPASALRRRRARDRVAGTRPPDPADDRRGPRTGRRLAPRPGRRRGRDASGAGRCPRRRPDRGQDAGPGARYPADRGRSPGGPSLRLPARSSGPRGLSLHRPGRLGRTYQPLPLPEPARVDAAGRHDRRRGRRGVRQGGEPAGPGLSRRPGDRAGGARPQSRRRLRSLAPSCTTIG